MRGVALSVAFAVLAAAAVAHPDVQMLGDEAAPSASARAAALEKVKTLITPTSKSKKGSTSGLAAKLKQVKERDGKKIAKYKFKASTAAKREDIKLHKTLNQQKELFVKKMKHAGTYKAKLAAVAKRAAKAVAQADVEADKKTAKLRIVTRKASYANAAEKTIAVLQTKLKSSGKATEMVAAKLKVDDKKIGKLRATIDGLKNGVKGQASKVAKAKEKKAKAKSKAAAKVKEGKAKAKKKVKEGKVKAKAKASKNKGKAAKHKLSAQKAKEKTSKAKAKASKHKAKAKKAVRKAAHKPKSGGSIESRIKHEKKLARAAHHRAASLHIKASVVHAKVGSKKAAAAAQSAAKASKAAANHKRLQTVTKLAKKINKKKKKAKKGKKGRKKKAKKKAKKAAKKAKKKAKKRAAKKKAKKKKHE